MIASVRARVSTATIVGDRRARERQVMHLLHTIDDVLVEQRFVFPLQYDSTLAQALEPRTVDRNTLFRILQRHENVHRREQILMHPERPVHFIACQQALTFVCVEGDEVEGPKIVKQATKPRRATRPLFPIHAWHS